MQRDRSSPHDPDPAPPRETSRWVLRVIALLGLALLGLAAWLRLHTAPERADLRDVAPPPPVRGAP